MKTVGRKDTRPGEFNTLSFIKIINDKLYVCDNENQRVQILNTQLEYLNTFGCHGDEMVSTTSQMTLPRIEQEIYT